MQDGGGNAVDDEVVEAARLGRPWALRQVHAWLAPPVAAYCRRFGCVDWEECTNDVLLAVLTALPSFTGGAGRVRTYAFTVAHHKVVDDLRRRSRTLPTVPWDQAGDLRVAPSAEDAATVTLGTEAVFRALAALAPDQRDVLLLRVVGDLTVEQVSEVLGKSVGAVKQLQRRALAALRTNSVPGVPL